MVVSSYKAEEDIVGDDEEDTIHLRRMAVEARKYLGGFSWCPPVRNLYLADGVGGLVAVFLVELVGIITEADQWLWVVIGDLPGAYFVTDCIDGPGAALQAYCEIMGDWVNAVRGGTSLDEVFPVPVPPTLENAALLEGRLKFLLEEIVPVFK